MNANSSSSWLNFYSQNKDSVKKELEEVIKLKEFEILMKEGQTSTLLDWNTLINGAFGLAFIIKGVTILYRE